jgi:formylglycine-generating enzyme required for sulfatase activity
MIKTICYFSAYLVNSFWKRYEKSILKKCNTFMIAKSENGNIAKSDKRKNKRSAKSGSNLQGHPAEPEMVFVQGGTFWMGCTSEQGSCENDEKPVHEVRLSSFYMGKYEVTQAQWETLMGSNPSNFKGGNLPVEQVNWNDAQMFIERLNAATGKQYRLPTEAEWEYAARAEHKVEVTNIVEVILWTMWHGSTIIQNAKRIR